jgi:hypothetical protein
MVGSVLIVFFLTIAPVVTDRLHGLGDPSPISVSPLAR